MAETEIPQIECERIRPSARNPRKTIDQDKLTTLSASIAAAGVQQPITIFELEDGAKGVDYEIIDGERRWRAAKLAGLEQIPAIIQKVTEEKAFHLRMIATLQREDIHPMEEADAYNVMLNGDPDAGIKPATVAEIAVETGKTPGQIYARLKLRSLAPAARKAYLAGKVTTATAQKLARLTAELQPDALAAVAGMTDTQASDHLLTNYTLSLGAAPFDTTDTTLPGGACEPCPKRAGNQALLFPDVKRKDTCTDPVCFKAKVAAGTERKVAEAKVLGAKELPASTAAKLYPAAGTNTLAAPGAKFLDLDAVCAEDPKKRTWRALFTEDGPKVYLAPRPEGDVRELVKTADAWAVLRGRKDLKWAAKGAAKDDDEEAEAPDAGKADRAKRQAEAKAHEIVCDTVISAVVAYAQQVDDPDLVRIMAAQTLEDRHGQAVAERRVQEAGGKGSGAKGYEASRIILNRLPDMPDDDVRGLLAEALIGRGIRQDPTGKRETLKAAAALCGLDLAKIEKQAKAQAAGRQSDARKEAEDANFAAGERAAGRGRRS